MPNLLRPQVCRTGNAKIVHAHGGGTQSVAISVLVVEGVLPRPDHIVMSDTAREASETWEYKEKHVDPLLAKVGLKIEIAPHSLASSDLWNTNDTLLIPAFSENGKLSNFCSGYWKRDVGERWLRSLGVKEHVLWLGFSTDEARRANPKGHRPYITNQFPLLDLGLSRQACYEVIKKAGLPPPPKSSCWMCPHRSDEQWARLRDHYPADWEAACGLDEQIREVDEANGNSGVWLHKSRTPLRLVELAKSDEQPLFNETPCNSGYCFI